MADVLSVGAQVQGEKAVDDPVAGNPVLVGGRASLDEPTAVSADGDAVFAWLDRFGRTVVVLGHPNPELPNNTAVTASGNTSLIVAPGASLSLYIVRGSAHNGGSSDIVLQLKDGSAGFIHWRALLAKNGGGSLFDFGSRGWKLTANTALFGNLSAGGDVQVNVTEYYIAP